MKNILRSTALLVLTLGLTFDVSAQTEVGECSVEPTVATHDAQQAMFRLDGAEYSELNLPVALQQALYDARIEHHKKQLQIIDAALVQLELDRKVEETGKSREALASELLDVPVPDDEAIATFYEINKDRIGYPLNAVREQLRQTLEQRSKQIRQGQLVAAIKSNRSFELDLQFPVAPIADIATDGFPSKGSPNAKVTLIEFADYQCPHCRNAAAALTKIANRFRDDARIVFMDFPVNPSGISRAVAEGAVCASQQGRFWPYHDLAFEQQDGLGPDSAIQFSVRLGLNVTEFRACLESPLPSERVARSEAEADRLGLSSTPTLFLNGRRLHLHNMDTELTAAIEDALAAEG